MTGEQPKRVWIDGCYDLWHYGHCNAIKQASQVEQITTVIAGIHSDKEIELSKGSPVMNDQEREAVVRSCRWVHEIVLEAPYTTSLAIMKNHLVDFCVHGEDITYGPNGEDSFQEVKDAGMFQLIKRTQGISTTDIIGRVLNTNIQHHESIDDALESIVTNCDHFMYSSASPDTHYFFSRVPHEHDQVILVTGSFDMFNISHVHLLEEARKKGTFLIVGVFSDSQINEVEQSYFPICNLHERVPVVAACKYVDAMIVGIPDQLTKEFLEEYNISLVVQAEPSMDSVVSLLPNLLTYPKEAGIYESITVPTFLTAEAIISRIIDERIRFEEKMKLSKAKMEKWMSN
jgi:ethanolamine-phosphate cytidylyltransferase